VLNKENPFCCNLELLPNNIFAGFEIKEKKRRRKKRIIETDIQKVIFSVHETTLLRSIHYLLLINY